MDRQRALKELQEALTQAEELSDLSRLKELFYRVQGIAQQFPQDAEVQALSARARQAAVTRGKKIQEQQRTPSPSVATNPPSTSVASAPKSAPSPSVPAGPETPPRPVPTLTAPRPTSTWRWRLALYAGLFGGILLAIPVIYSLSRKDLGPPRTDTTKGIPVLIRTNPSGAVIRVNGEVRGNSELQVDLPVGEYQVEASLDGFQSALTTVRPEFGRNLEVSLDLAPMAQSLRIFTDFEQGQVFVNEETPRALEQGQLVLNALPAGTHKVRVVSPQGRAEFTVDATPGKMPVVKPGIQTQSLMAVLVANLGSKAQIHSSSPTPMPVVLDGRSVGNVGPEGLPLEAMTGDHELLIGSGALMRKLVVGLAPAPVLSAYLKLDIDAGTMVVLTGEDEVSVFVDGQERRRKTSGGQLRIAGLPVKKYTVRVVKNGFLDVAEQTVEIRKGEETRVAFQMKSRPRVASLQLAGAVPGSVVLLDGQTVGMVKPDGTLQLANLQPGDRTLEVRADKYVPRRIPIKLVAGQTFEIAPRDLAMEIQKGTLRVNVTPANAKVSIRRDNERTPSPLNANPLQLVEGTYIVSASAPDHADRSMTVQVEAGQTRTLDLRLSEVKTVQVTVKSPPGGIEGFENAGAFRKEGEWFVRKGGGAVLYRPTPGGGTFSFAMFLKKGTGIFRTSRLQFVVDYRDQKNYVMYQIDPQRINRVEVVDGKRKGTAVPNKLGDMEFYGLSVDVRQEGVTLRGKQAGGNVVLDSFTRADDATDGRFGLLIPGGDEFAIGEFRFTPR